MPLLTSFYCAWRESNPQRRSRSPMFYPLNYSRIFSLICFTNSLFIIADKSVNFKRFLRIQMIRRFFEHIFVFLFTYSSNFAIIEIMYIETRTYEFRTNHYDTRRNLYALSYFSCRCELCLFELGIGETPA